VFDWGVCYCSGTLDGCGICNNTSTDDNTASTGICDCNSVPENQCSSYNGNMLLGDAYNDPNYGTDDCTAGNAHAECVGGNTGGIVVDDDGIEHITGLDACVQDCNTDGCDCADVDENNLCDDMNNDGDQGGPLDVGVCVGGTNPGEECRGNVNCGGFWGGTAEVDECSNCTGGTTGAVRAFIYFGSSTPKTPTIHITSTLLTRICSTNADTNI
jgi:hypothetical protein